MTQTKMTDLLAPNREGFNKDPGGYAALAWMRWAIAQNMAGLPVDPTQPPKAEDLKDPILWLTQAQALSVSAVTLAKHQPAFSEMPLPVRGVCDSQYCAIVLMLVGFSLEVSLKAMIIIRDGVDAFMKMESKHLHHRLSELAAFIPDLSAKDHGILKMLTHFVYWAGRYPDPGTKRHDDMEDVFTLAETHQISAHDVFDLAGRVLGHVRALVPDD